MMTMLMMMMACRGYRYTCVLRLKATVLHCSLLHCSLSLACLLTCSGNATVQFALELLSQFFGTIALAWHGMLCYRASVGF